MIDSTHRGEEPRSVWRLDFYQDRHSVDGQPINRSIMTNSQCRVTTLLRPGPLAHRFSYQEVWRDVSLDFGFEAMFVGGINATTYQVFLARALEDHPEYWIGSRRDNDLLSHLMRCIREALCLLRSGPTEDTRIKRVEFALSSWSRWKTFSNFKTAEIVLGASLNFRP